MGFPPLNIKSILQHPAGTVNTARSTLLCASCNFYDTPFRTNVSLKQETKGTRTVLLFLRYWGCTLCQLDIHLLKEGYDKIRFAGGQVKVILQSDPENIAASSGGPNALPFEIICDPQMALYRRFDIQPAKSKLGLAGKQALYKLASAEKLGLKHGLYEGDELQLPAAFIIDSEMQVLYAHYGKNAGDIPSVDQLAELLRN
ncbi:peroxiredoxin-like family protein [Hungatella sp.]|nr:MULTISPECIES: peroxiredoxin-like family protein [Hungatella]